MINVKLSELLNKWDETIENWNNIPDNPPSWNDEEVDWTENDWTVNMFYCGRFDLWYGFESSDKPVVRPCVRVFHIGDKNEKC